MTGKELMLALVGAGLVGGAAGAAASFVAAQKPEAAPQQPSPELVALMKSTEAELAKTRTALEDSRKAVNDLTERVTASEMKAAHRAADAIAAPGPGRGLHVVRRAHPPGEKAGEAGFGSAVATELDADSIDLGDAGGQIGDELGQALNVVSGDIGAGGGFAALKSGLDLRKLPEADRWQKAKDDLGLTWNQVEEMKKAVADRDAAMKDAMASEKKTSPAGGTITIQRPDEGKMAHASADYHDHVKAALNEDQRKSWQSKGYDHAFGSSPFGAMGGAMAISFTTTSDTSSDKASDKPGDAPKAAPK